MKKSSIPLLTYLLTLLVFTSCRHDDGSPIRNVRFDPNLLNQAQDGSPCASYSYAYADEMRNLGAVYTKQVLVAFADGLAYEEQLKAVEEYGFVDRLNGQTSSNSAMLHTLVLKDGLNCKQVEQALVELAKDGRLSYVSPYFMKGNELLGLSNEAIVTVEENGKAAFESAVRSFGAEVVTALGENTYVVKVDKNANGNALAVANYLKEQAGVAHAEPDFIVSLAPEERTPGMEYRRARNGVGR
mgnify:FL=1